MKTIILLIYLDSWAKSVLRHVTVFLMGWCSFSIHPSIETLSDTHQSYVLYYCTFTTIQPFLFIYLSIIFLKKKTKYLILELFTLLQWKCFEFIHTVADKVFSDFCDQHTSVAQEVLRCFSLIPRVTSSSLVVAISLKALETFTIPFFLISNHLIGP